MPLPQPQQRSVPIHSRRLAVLCLLVATSLFVGACGSNDDDNNPGSQPAAASTSTPTPAANSKPATGSGSTVSLQPKGDQLLFDTDTLTAKAGKVTVDFTNDSAIPHNVTLIDSANKTLGETPTFDGGTKSFNATLKAGHLHLLLLGAGPSPGRHAGHADRQLGRPVDAAVIAFHHIEGAEHEYASALERVSGAPWLRKIALRGGSPPGPDRRARHHRRPLRRHRRRG